MFGIAIDSDDLRWVRLLDPQPRPDEVLVQVAAAGVNRADLLQRRGHYPPPAGASDILGLECSGTVIGVGSSVTDWREGDQVCALLSGGGYAERVVVPTGQLLPIPAGVSLVDAAGLPEAACTAWATVAEAAHAQPGELLLVHGGSGGIGSFTIQLAVALGVRVAATAGSPAGLARCLELGAEVAINHRSEDFVDRVRHISDGRGADAIVDLIGAKYLDRNLAALAPDGRLVVIGLQGGAVGELNLGQLLAKRGAVIGTTLRGRPRTGPHSKAELIAQVREHVWPLIDAGRIRPTVGARLPIVEADRAHRLLEHEPPGGKLLLTVADPA